MHTALIALLVVTTVFFSCAHAENRWVWSSRDDNNQKQNGILSARYEDSLHRRSAREREPTTRRPLPGQPQNDEIDDYPEPDEQTPTNTGTRNFPYPNYNSGQLFGANNYPGAGIGGNGILVGPGGPTGIIGRPQQQFPGNYPPNGFVGQPGVGFPTQPGGFGGGNGLPGAFAGSGQGQFGGVGFPGAEAGLNPGAFGAQYPGGQFGGATPNGVGGQYPVGGQFPGAGAQYPVGAGQFPAGGQYPAGAQYPGGFGAQYPGGQFQGGQYPTAAQYPGGGPQYTEGYGLAYTNNGFPGGIGGFPGASPYGYATGLRDYDNTKRKLQATEKSADAGGGSGVESRNLVDQRVDDKINKGFKKVPN